MDFGLAKSTEVKDKSLTQSGEVLGTPQYMAPEQAKGLKREFDNRTDIYAIGAVLYHMLHGKPPATGDTLMEVLRQVTETTPVFSKELPKAIKHICKKAMEKKKKFRYQNTASFSYDIEKYIQGKNLLLLFFIIKEIFFSAANIFSRPYSFSPFSIILYLG